MINFRQKAENILIWSQKYTQTDMIYLAKGGFWLTLGQALSIIGSFLLAISFANFLPQETYGQYQYILSIIAILTIFTLPGMNWAIAQGVARGYEGSFITGLKTRIRWGVLGGLVSLGLAGYYFFNHNLILGTSFLIAALFLPLMDSLAIFHGYLKGKKLFKYLAKYTLISQLISAGFLIVALYLTNNLFLIFLTYFISNTVLGFIFFNLTCKNFLTNKKEDPQTLSFGKHLSLIDVASLIASRLDHILLWQFLGAGPLAVYSFALIVPQKIINIFNGVIQPLIFPKLSEKKIEDLKNNLSKKALKLFLVLLPIVLVYIISAPFLFEIFFPKYLESVFYSQIFAFSILLFPETLFGTALAAQMKKKQLYIYKFTASFIRIIFLLILTPLYGIIGAILAILISQVIVLGLVVFLFRRI